MAKKNKVKRFNKRKAKKKLEAWCWKTIRQYAIARDKGCVICGKMDEINVHHIYPRENLLLRYRLENLVCLCSLHHKYSLELSAHRNPFKFFRWMIENKPNQLMQLHYLE